MSQKLGDIWTGPDGRKYILTTIMPLPIQCVGFEVWTPIPKGEDETGLGKHFHAASVRYIPLEPVQRLERFEELKPDA